MTRHRGVSQAPSNGTCEIRDRTVSPASTSPLGAPPAVSASYGNTLSPGGQTPSYDTDDRDNGLTDAASTAAAASCSPKCSSICAPAQTCPIGLHTPLPAMSGAEPCTGSNMLG